MKRWVQGCSGTAASRARWRKAYRNATGRAPACIARRCLATCAAPSDGPTALTVNLRTSALLFGPLGGLALGLLLAHLEWDTSASLAAGITAWTVLWWIFEPIPIPVSSLLPIALLPLLGVLPQKEVSAAYGDPLILLLMGGFLLSTAMARSGAHRRVALYMVNLFGGNSSRRLVFGFMAASATLSMWISNTATALMLVPVALAVLERAEDRKLAAPLLLGIAYAASIGGIGTPIGTPPNLVFMQVYTTNTGNEISFLTWMLWGVPVVLLFLPIMGWWLTRNLDWTGSLELPDAGRWSTEEKRVFMVFGLTALAWITRREPFGGWSGLLDLPAANDGIVAMLAAVLMFLVPNGRGGRLLDWETAARIPWGVLILFAAGLAIAKAFVATGLSAGIGDGLSALSGLHPLIIIAVVCLTITFLTEMTSNTATATLMMPILAAAALGAHLPPELLMVPAAMSASCAFMLPVATAPNSVVFGTGRIAIAHMAREGLALNLIGACVITVAAYLMLT